MSVKPGADDLTVGTEFDPRHTLTMSRDQYAVWLERRRLFLRVQP